MQNPFRSRKQSFTLGLVPVCTARLLVVGPAWIDEDALHELVETGRGIILDLEADGGYDIFRNPDGSHTID